MVGFGRAPLATGCHAHVPAATRRSLKRPFAWTHFVNYITLYHIVQLRTSAHRTRLSRAMTTTVRSSRQANACALLLAS